MSTDGFGCQLTCVNELDHHLLAFDVESDESGTRRWERADLDDLFKNFNRPRTHRAQPKFRIGELVGVVKDVFDLGQVGGRLGSY